MITRAAALLAPLLPLCVLFAAFAANQRYACHETGDTQKPSRLGEEPGGYAQ